MGRTELMKLYKLQQKIIEQSTIYYKDKPVIKKENSELFGKVLRLAEELFPDYIVLVYNEKSERNYISSNVKNKLQYSSNHVIKLSDLEFLENIHPDDVRSVRLVMEEIYSMSKEDNYDHTAIRYKINLRYKGFENNYAHISYEAITIQFEGHYADIVLIKNITNDELFQHVELVVSKKTQEGFVKIKHFIPEQRKGLLTPREKDIINLLERGLSISQAALKLGISISTVKNHRVKLFKKLNVRNSLQLLNSIRKVN